MLIQKKLIRTLLFLILAFALLGCVSAFANLLDVDHPLALNQDTKESSIHYEKAQVTKILSQSISNESGGMKFGSQTMNVKILSGEFKGSIEQVTNYMSDTHNVYLKEGMKLIVEIDKSSADNYSVLVYNYYRAPFQYALLALFFLAICLIGGIKGLKSILGLVFTFLSVIFFFIPMLYKGYSPIFCAIIIVVLTTCVTLLLLNGFTSKTLCAILGTIIGLVFSGIIALVFGHLAHLNGINMNDIETLNMIAGRSEMHISGLLYAGILIASLGAVMDVSISIASSIQEIYAANPSMSKKELFFSGMNVGRDMMGTMTNTLILAFAGSSLTTLIIIHAYNVDFNQLMNMDLVNVELIQSLTGSLGIVLTLPIVAFISSEIVPSFFKSPQNKASHLRQKSKKIGLLR